MDIQPPESIKDCTECPSLLEMKQYELVANRRLAWDQMLWQMPATALTGQAFLFVIAFTPNASTAARIITSTLALFVSVASIASIGRFRISEITDARFLFDFEQRFGGSPAFGPSWRDRRTATRSDLLSSASRLRPMDWIATVMAGLRGLLLWILCFVLFGVAALLVIATSIFAPELLRGGA
jgi:hypothetical protein